MEEQENIDETTDAWQNMHRSFWEVKEDIDENYKTFKDEVFVFCKEIVPQLENWIAGRFRVKSMVDGTSIKEQVHQMFRIYIEAFPDNEDETPEELEQRTRRLSDYYLSCRDGETLKLEPEKRFEIIAEKLSSFYINNLANRTNEELTELYKSIRVARYKELCFGLLALLFFISAVVKLIFFPEASWRLSWAVNYILSWSPYIAFLSGSYLFVCYWDSAVIWYDDFFECDNRLSRKKIRQMAREYVLDYSDEIPVGESEFYKLEPTKKQEVHYLFWVGIFPLFIKCENVFFALNLPVALLAASIFSIQSKSDSVDYFCEHSFDLNWASFIFVTTATVLLYNLGKSPSRYLN